MFRQSSSPLSARVLPGGAHKRLQRSPALAACDCPLALSRLGKPLTQGPFSFEPLLSPTGISRHDDTAHYWITSVTWNRIVWGMAMLSTWVVLPGTVWHPPATACRR